jgi:hypothetical protein
MLIAAVENFRRRGVVRATLPYRSGEVTGENPGPAKRHWEGVWSEGHRIAEVARGRRDWMSLESDFHRACEAAVDECRLLGYVPTAWIQMMNGPGGAAGAARRLLANGDIQSGFERLIRLGRVDLTVEYAVLQERWSDLFADQHREAARWRLDQAGSR